MRLLLMLSLVGGLSFGCASAKFEPVVRPVGFDAGGPCTPQSGPPGAAAMRASEALATKRFEDTLAALSNEFPEKHRQFVAREREPLQRFPRLTFPAMVDPDPADGARKSASWLFPVIIDKRQLGEIPPDAMTGELRFWLVPHGSDVTSDNAQDITECLVRSGQTDSIFVADDDREADVRPAGAIVPTIARPDRLRGLVFEVPTQTADASSAVPPGFYNLRILPRLNALDGIRVGTPELTTISNALQEGDWARALEAVVGLDPSELTGPGTATDLRSMAARVAPQSDWMWTFHPSPHFDLDLQALRDGLGGLADVLDRSPSNRGALQRALSRVERPMRSMLAARQSVAPISLKDPASERGRCGGRDCIRVAVAGDFQYHGNLGPLRRFLGMIDPEFVQAGGADGPDAGPDNPVPDVDFVLFAGDLADAAAGSAKEELLLNTLGVLPPISPYGPEGGNEMPEIRDQLAHFQKPFFAVPGNHDGYAGFGGILNVIFDELGFLTEEAFGLARAPRLGRTAGNAVKSVNSFLPSFVGWRLLNRHPRYDGLAEYQSYLGPLNLAFEFRGHSFVGLNSYDLKPKERAAVGGVVLYWGGGVQDESVAWMDDMLSRFAPEPGHQQFVFMHHDPRGAVPTKNGYTEGQFGLFDAIDTPISQLTLGHAGLGNSPETGLYFPIVSFLGTFLSRGIEIGWGDTAGTFQQEWMRRPDWGWSLFSETRWPRFFDQEAYNAQGLIEVINCNLSGRTVAASPPVSQGAAGLCKQPQGSITQILFAHDNVPVSGTWGDPNERGAVFREPDEGQLWRPGWRANSIYGQLGGLVGFKFRNGSPPEWAQHMHLDPEQGNAQVLRMDDVGDAGNYHGFHVVTIYADGETDSKWYALPR